MDAKLKRKLDKLVALSTSSNEHEASNAMSRLEKLCAANNVVIDELLDQDNTTERCWYRYDNPYIKTLLEQLGAMVAPDHKWIFTNRAKQRQVGFDLTKAQKAEYDLYYSIMRSKLKEHLELSVVAFINANDLFPERADTEEIDWDNFDLERAQKIADMAGSIDKTHVHKRLEK